MTDAKKPMAEANRISSMLNTVLGADRFPVRVDELALEYSRQCFADSPIDTVRGEDLDGFDGLLKANKALDGLPKNGELKKTFLVVAKDDYQIAFSVGEIHPEFGNTPLMIATEVDGKPIEGGPRIIVPGDKRGARAVQEIVKIELR